MRRIFDTKALALCLGLIAGPVAAQSVNLPIDHSMRVNMPGSAASIVVGNPNIADVTVIDSRTLFITGRGFGATNVIALDRSGQTLFAGDVVVTSHSSDVSVYRSAARQDYACAPGCNAYARASGGGGGSQASGPASAAATASGIAGAKDIAPVAQGAANAGAQGARAGMSQPPE
ncbi:MAG: pilus assembly protein N-terminal domain-containing protein [Caulobacteraceae bacterium]